MVRTALETVGWERAIVQRYGDTHEVLIRIPQGINEGQDIGGQVEQALQPRVPGQTIDIRRTETVGAQVIQTSSTGCVCTIVCYARDDDLYFWTV